MRNPMSGVRGRVTFTVLAVTAALYSVIGAIGFVSIADNGRSAIRERIEEVLDQLETSLISGSGAMTLSTTDGVDASIVAIPAIPPPQDGIVQVTRRLTVNGTNLALVGTSPDARLTDSLRSLFRAMWIAIPLAAIITALMAGLATRRALRPVGSITSRAASIDTPTAGARVPVPDTDDEITQLAITLNSMLDRVDAAHFAQRQFTSDAAHELRTPLMALQGELELLAGGVQQLDTATLTRLISLGARLGQRIDDLLLLSTLDEYRPLALRDVDLAALIRDEIADISPDAALIGTAPTIRADEQLVARALRNLLGNAKKHGAGNTRVVLENVDGRVGLHVDDDGPGVPSDDANRIFGRFARLDASRDSAVGGAGLGLAIVAAIATAHGGSVAVTKSDLGGARFTMWLPVDGTPVNPTSGDHRPT